VPLHVQQPVSEHKLYLHNATGVELNLATLAAWGSREVMRLLSFFIAGGTMTIIAPRDLDLGSQTLIHSHTRQLRACLPVTTLLVLPIIGGPQGGTDSQTSPTLSLLAHSCSFRSTFQMSAHMNTDMNMEATLKNQSNKASDQTVSASAPLTLLVAAFLGI
jgi:hypothetical protein